MSGWVSCCRGRGSNCPKLRVSDTDRTVEIKDDYGNMIILTYDQFAYVVEDANKLINQDTAD